MSSHSANLARIAVLGILQSFGMSGIKSRQALDRIEADGYVIVPSRYVTCIECEAHLPESRTVTTQRGAVCRTCETELRRTLRKVVAP